MAFSLTEDQEALRSTIERSFSELCTSEFVRTVSSRQEIFDQMQKLLQSLGLFEYFGEKEATLAELSFVAFEAGRNLLPSCVVEALFFGPFCAARYTPLKSALSKFAIGESELKKGSKRVVFGIALNKKEVSFVSDASASAIVVCAPFEEKTKSLKIQSLSFQNPHQCLDITRGCHFVPAEKGASLPDEISQQIIFEFMILIASEMCGVASKAIAMTKEYVLTRKQFGVPIGSFQAVQQQLADAYMRSEAGIALTQFAADVAVNDRKQLPLAARSALLFAAQSAPTIVETAIQLHGGIGFTWEYDLHLYLRRVQTLASLYALGHDDEQAILADAV